MAHVNIQIVKTGSENNMSVLRRFRRRVQSAGIVKTVRGQRHASRPESKFLRKKNKLKRLERKAEVEKLIKLGKITPRQPYR